jgi:hypothetical protein
MMTKPTFAERFRRWLLPWYEALIESARLASVDWTGWRGE